MYLNISKAVDLANSLEMIKGNNDIFNNYELKFLKKQEEEKAEQLRLQREREAYGEAAGLNPENQDEYQMEA